MNKEVFMISKSNKQSSFIDTDYLCDKLVPQDDFYRKFKEVAVTLPHGISGLNMRLA
jgi:hypothetical protein